MEFDAVFTVKKEIEKETFLRQLLINLGTNVDTPADVVNAKMCDVQESVKELIVCTARVSGICNASVGYDRQEPYTDYENYKEKVGDSYVTRQRVVTKYRTVTDWRPFNTEYSGEATCAAYNDESVISNSNAITAVRTAKSDNIIPKGEATLCSAGLKEVVASCEAEVEWNTVSFPGDHHKDVRFNSTSEVESVSCYKLPYYEVKYTYDGKEYCASCFACGDVVVDCDYPPKNIDIAAEAKKMTKESEKKSKTAWCICFGALGLTAIVCYLLKFSWFWPISIVALVYAIITNKKYNTEYEECTKSLSSNVGAAKIKELKQALINYGYQELSDDESSKAEIESVSITKKPKKFTSKIVICAILSLVMMISSFVVNNNNLHSPKQVIIAVTGMSHEYKENVSPYLYGCYYINTNFKVDAKKTGVEYIKMKVHVKDKKGNELGVLKTSLERMNLDAGQEKTITTTWQENQPEKNEFFSLMYKTNFDDLSFEIEIGSIQFTDGKYYFNKDYNEFN